MYKKQIFTVDKVTHIGLDNFITRLHNDGMKYVIIVVSNFYALQIYLRIVFREIRLAYCDQHRLCFGAVLAF